MCLRAFLSGASTEAAHEMDNLATIAILVALLALSGFFSGSETALISMTKLRIRRARETHGAKAQSLTAWEKHSDRLLTTLLIGNNLVNIAAASLTAVVVSEFISNPNVAIWVNTVVMTSIILVMSEILPKQIAKRKFEPLAMRVAGPLWFLSIVLFPFVWVFGGIAHLVARLMNVPDSVQVISRDDVEAVVGAAGDEGSLARDERFILEEALDLPEARVREIMTPRVRMVTVQISDGVETIKRLIARTGYSRLPVQGPDESIVGVLFAKDIILVYESGESPTPIVASDLMRPAHFVPEMVPVARVLETFRTHRVHIAIVIGEYGEVRGLVTMEDVLEKLVGSIEDEHDQLRSDVRRLSPRRIVAKGSVRLDDLRRTQNIRLPEGDYETIGGYFTHELGSIPTRGAALRWKQWLIQAYDVDGRHVEEVVFFDVMPRRRDRRQDTAASAGAGGSRS